MALHIQMTDASAAVTLTRQYDAWGNPLQGLGTSGYAFTGREWDAETGLYYYRARYYDAKIGRFISEDPIGLGGGVNRYDYVVNRPTVWMDPLGLQPLPVPPAPTPQDDDFCWNIYLQCKDDADWKAFLIAAACTAGCLLFFKGPQVGICIAGCMAAAGIYQIKRYRQCTEEYWDCVKTNPQKKPPKTTSSCSQPGAGPSS